MNKHKYSDFKFISVIGQGGGGTIFNCEYKDGTYMVVKELTDSSFNQEDSFRELHNLILA